MSDSVFFCSECSDSFYTFLSLCSCSHLEQLYNSRFNVLSANSIMIVISDSVCIDWFFFSLWVTWFCFVGMLGSVGLDAERCSSKCVDCVFFSECWLLFC